ncbi:GNAT family N-acetyltransferase [Rhodospirillum rubrum]|uniref:GCN5-related N-acetyltransferase n=1 Tax=Rhodospirillum rubrum (strain ATCC 11170 / ATH 1.1.1 / DSM 467 / LMG 4362 / NCIMB 8255 / S1) TaxID=269796 RepID=Q2RXT4_RHORT|nr:GNAT family N-acetyltransferase [Rhodospirillum rubrum]ABC21061.1 GCN5-related N-acetyltransferase [Rhodospirillum rubrum ATCC 11170]AEO46729.1 GCN5-related N-acetyltransferase [Rhodospirillum rubrum F11]MBK5952605.1 GNAT family N-acetyltransferase [Rhodospirillum rubrum]QXG80754.1 GNAT family N-acetyltransferase [Rhodospirillum rubrum]HAP98943.1 GNAT family N-acetyltransferase [Rhodospirillum rubrum]
MIAPNPWRAMTAQDLALTYPLGEEIHSGFPESPAVQPERLALFPAGCRVAEDAKGTLLGYCISHPGVSGRPPALDSLLGGLPAGADCLYIHDVCLRREARGQGLVGLLLGALADLARDHGLGALALTAVGGADGVWRRHGFTDQPIDAALRAKLASYRGIALPMVRRL